MIDPWDYRDLVGDVVYRLYSRGRMLLYVGKTNNLGKRLAAHQNAAPWWWQIDAVSVQWCEDSTAAYYAEHAAIVQERPFYNRQWVPTVWNPLARALKAYQSAPWSARADLRAAVELARGVNPNRLNRNGLVLNHPVTEASA